MTITNDSLGRLDRVPVREIWADEARDFTPWLAQPENIALLGEVVGMQLEVEAQEQNVGPFRADILCKDVTADSWVLVENQLERTDHTHLGQLLTYAAGLDAVAIIWVAQRFTDQHRAALDWLNEKTPEGIGFFGLEIELWRIGDSPVAPKFNEICKPNEWTRTIVRNSSWNPELAALCQEYWTGVLAALEPSGIVQGAAHAFRKRDMHYPVGWKNFVLKTFFSSASGEIGLWVSTRGSRGFKNYLELEASKEQIENAFGESLDWNPYEDDNRGTCIKVYENFDAENREDWERQHTLLAEKLVALHAAVSPFIEKLDTAEQN